MIKKEFRRGVAELFFVYRNFKIPEESASRILRKTALRSFFTYRNFLNKEFAERKLFVTFY